MTSGDISIADALGSPAGELVLVDALTRQTIDGPYASLRDAVQAARALRSRATIWREFVDRRGRLLGSPIPLDWHLP